MPVLMIVICRFEDSETEKKLLRMQVSLSLSRIASDIIPILPDKIPATNFSNIKVEFDIIDIIAANFFLFTNVAFKSFFPYLILLDYSSKSNN